MRVFIAGATGVLGRRLIRDFQANGHEVRGLARDGRGEQIVDSLGGEPRRADLFDVASLTRAAEGAEVVIHAATAIPTTAKPTSADWDLNDRIRREGTRALTTAAAGVGARIYLQQSIAWVARPSDGSPFDEDSPPNPDRITQSALDGEQIAQEAGDRDGYAVGVLRCGLFYAADSAHIRRFAELLAARRLPIVGRGDAAWSCLHADDASGAFVAAAEAGRRGLWHVVDNRPVTVRGVLVELARRIGAPRPLRVPVWLARLLVGSAGLRYFTTSTRTSNARFRREVGWEPRYPTIREGLDEVVAAWQAEGAPFVRRRSLRSGYSVSSGTSSPR